MARSLSRLERKIDTSKVDAHTFRNVVRLANFIRSHGFPCRVVQGRKVGSKLMLRCAMLFGCDPSSPLARKFPYTIEMVRPNMTAVREWLGY